MTSKSSQTHPLISNNFLGTGGSLNSVAIKNSYNHEGKPQTALLAKSYCRFLYRQNHLLQTLLGLNMTHIKLVGFYFSVLGGWSIYRMFLAYPGYFPFFLSYLLMSLPHVHYSSWLWNTKVFSQCSAEQLSHCYPPKAKCSTDSFTPNATSKYLLQWRAFLSSKRFWCPLFYTYNFTSLCMHVSRNVLLISLCPSLTFLIFKFCLYIFVGWMPRTRQGLNIQIYYLTDSFNKLGTGYYRIFLLWRRPVNSHSVR